MATAKQAARSGRNTFVQQVRNHLEQAAEDGEAVTNEEKKGLSSLINGEWVMIKNTPHCVGTCGHVMAASTVWSTPGQLRLVCPECAAKAKIAADDELMNIDDLLKIDE